MSEHIDWTLEVISGMAAIFVSSHEGPEDLTTTRVALTHEVAAAHGVEFQSVQDRYTRKIGCETVGDFDNLLRRWLQNGDLNLKRRLLTHCDDPSDSLKVERAFAQPPSQDFGDVTTAFDLLLDEIDNLVRIQRKQASNALREGYIESAVNMRRRAHRLAVLKERVQALSDEWGL